MHTCSQAEMHITTLPIYLVYLGELVVVKALQVFFTGYIYSFHPSVLWN